MRRADFVLRQNEDNSFVPKFRAEDEIAHMQGNARLREAENISMIALLPKKTMQDEAIGALFYLANEIQESVSAAGFHGIGIILRDGDPCTREKAFGILEPNVMMDYRKIFNPNRDYDAELAALKETTPNGLGNGSEFQIRSQRVYEPIAIRELEQSRSRTGRFLAGLLGSDNTKPDSSIWDLIETAMNSPRPEIQKVGQEMVDLAMQSSNAVVSYKANRLNDTAAVRD